MMFEKKENVKTDEPKTSKELPLALAALKRWRISIVLVVVMIIVLRVCFGIVQSQNTAYAAIQGQLSSLQNQQKMDDITGNKKDASTKKEISGLDTARKKTDDGIAETFFSKCLDWDDYKSYNKCRNWAADQKNKKPFVNVKDMFLDTFFPDITETQDADGNMINMIDKNQLNASFDDSTFTTHVTDIDSTGNVYTYLAEFNILTTSKYEDSEGTTHSVDGSAEIAATYTVDSAGNMDNVIAYTIVE